MPQTPTHPVRPILAPSNGAPLRAPSAARKPRLGRAALRSAALLIATGALVLGVASAAEAHVSVESSSTEGGSWTILTFRVPTESDSASTTAIRVELPEGAPFSSVRTEPVPGWTAKIERSGADQTPSAIVWTATGDGFGPEEFGEFTVSAGPLPESGTVAFPTVQTYSDGTEVDWVQQAEGDTEPEHPAPSIELTAATGEAGDGHSVGSSGHGDSADASDVTEAATDESTTAGVGGAVTLALSIAALTVALAAAVVALLGLRRRG